VVGCGLIAQIAHLPYLQELAQSFEISAICATSPSRVEQVGQRYNVPKRYLDYRELVEQDLDAVFVLTRDHADIAIAAAERGKHVFVEKPIAFNLEEADAMTACARKHGVKLLVGYMRRYDPGFQRAQKIFEETKGDRLVRVHSSVGLPFRIVQEMYDLIPAQVKTEKEITFSKAREERALLQAIGQERSGLLRAYSLLLHLWSHNINILRGAFGDPRQINYAEVRLGKQKASLPPPLQIVAVLDYGTELSCLWESRAFMAHEAWDEELALFGSERTVRVRFPFPYLKYTPAVVTVEETVSGTLIHQEIVTSYDEAFKRELKHFYDCIIKDVEPITSGEDARKDLELAIRMINKVAQ
jgi:predicted dehydrogenase